MRAEVEWISKTEWQALLRKSARLQTEINFRTREGMPVTELWAELRIVNRRIRSPQVKVHGIDNRRKDQP